MRFALPRNAVLIHLAAAVAFLGSGCCHSFRLASFLPLVWLIPAILEMILLFPPARRRERIKESRRRASRHLLRDPIFYLGLGILIYITCQSLNGPCRLAYSLANQAWYLTPPPLRLLPYCLDRHEAFEAFFWFLAAWGGVLAVRIGLTRRAKMRLLQLLVAIATFYAVTSLLHYASGAELSLWGLPATLFKYGTFADTSAAGLFYAIALFVAGGLLLQALTSGAGVKESRLLYAAMLLNLLAALFSLDVGVLLLLLIGGGLWLVYALFYLYHSCSKAQLLRYLAILLLTGMALAFLHLVAYPENRLHQKFDVIKAGVAGNDSWWQERKTLRQAAWRSFKAAPLYGTGTWSFQHTVGTHLSDSEWVDISPEQQTPLSCFSDPLQLLQELGLVGSSMLLAALILIWLVPLKRIVARVRATSATAKEIDAIRLKRLSPVAISILLALLGATLFSLLGMPLRTPLLLLVYMLLLATLPALLPLPQPSDVNVIRPGDKNDQKRSGKWQRFLGKAGRDGRVRRVRPEERAVL